MTLPVIELDRPVLRWHGGKWLLAPWIIEHFPRHDVYVEPFGGAASVLLRKQRSAAEVYNDLDRDVVNLFRVLRSSEDATELERRLRLTPFARDEFLDSYQVADEPVEHARQTVVRSFMGFSTDAVTRKYRTGFRARLAGAFPSREWAAYPDTIAQLVERLAGVLVENAPAIDVIKRYDSPTTLLYVDPPYVKATRTALTEGRGAAYRHEMTDGEHDALVNCLLDVEAMVVLSGHPHPIYDDRLMTWRRVMREVRHDKYVPRNEVLWINPACAAALDAEQPSLLHMMEAADA